MRNLHNKQTNKQTNKQENTMSGNSQGAKKAWKTMRKNEADQKQAIEMLEKCKRSDKVEILDTENGKVIFIKK